MKACIWISGHFALNSAEFRAMQAFSFSNIVAICAAI